MILFFASDFKPLSGGIAEYAHQLCLHVNRDKAVVSTIPHDLKTEEISQYPVHRVNWKTGTDSPFLSSIAPVRKACSAWLTRDSSQRIRSMLAKFTASGSDDSVVITSWCLVGSLVCNICRELKIPYSIIAHGNELRFPMPEKLEKKRTFDFKNARVIFTNSSFTKKIVESFGIEADKIFIIPPGIEEADFPDIDEKKLEEIDRKLGIASKKIVLSICRLAPRKGIELSLKAFADLYSEFPEYMYVIAGDGPERERLTNVAQDLGINDQVIFLGNVDQDDKCALYKRSELFVMPNLNLGERDVEGFGIVFLEAAMYGKPSIGGKNGGVVDAVIEGETGLLVDTSIGYEPFRDALKAMMTDPQRAEQMGTTARIRAVKDFSWTRIAEKFENLLARHGI